MFIGCRRGGKKNWKKKARGSSGYFGNWQIFGEMRRGDTFMRAVAKVQGDKRNTDKIS